MFTAVFWDIDGTLLTTGRAGVFAWQDAVREVCRADVDLFAFHTSGLTDAQIAARLQDEYGSNGSGDAQARGLLESYERHLPAALHRRRGHVLPGVREILEGLVAREDVTSILLTGNTPVGARAKLDHYGLSEFFPGEGAFCLGLGERSEIAKQALALAEEAYNGRLREERVFVVGDTPHDVRCGQAIGARTIAVATGTYSLEELEAADPWLALPELQADRFLELIDSQP